MNKLLSTSLWGVAVLLLTASLAAAQEPDADTDKDSDIAALKAQVERLQGMVPDQAHVMKDVGYHFSNLWFAGQQRNWPLAAFYLGETRNHLRWAVRIIPIRKTPQGGELRLADILEPMEKSVLKDLQESIVAQDPAAFRKHYLSTLESCYACHEAAGKPYLRLQVPSQPEAPIIHYQLEP